MGFSMNQQWSSLNLVSDTLPRTVKIEGKSYPIQWDFTAALKFMEYVDTSQDEDEVFLKKVLEIWYPTIPENTDEALTQAIRFYCGGDLPGEGYYTPVFAPLEEKTGIREGFLKHFGIDLEKDTVHWWIFRRLLTALRERRKTW